MNAAELMRLLDDRYRENFAEEVAAQVVDTQSFDVLFEVASSPHCELPSVKRHQLLFRSAYVLETIYFCQPELLRSHLDEFAESTFPTCTDPSARRHFGKIMADLLWHESFSPEVLDRIAEAAAEWIVDPASRAAVRIGAVEVLRRCRSQVAWVDEMWVDLIETLSQDQQPSIQSRLRQHWCKKKRESK